VGNVRSSTPQPQRPAGPVTVIDLLLFTIYSTQVNPVLEAMSLLCVACERDVTCITDVKLKRQRRAIPVTGRGGIYMFPVRYEQHLYLKK
jgi:hypothetical protein